MSASPFAQAAQDFVALGFQPVPILPPSASHHAGRGKAPGHITSGHWSGLSRWQTYRTTPPPDFLFKLWLKMPDAGVGLICGTPAGKDDQGEPLFVLGVDIDVDGDDLDTIVRALPHTPMAKAGRVGLTRWYRAPAEIGSRSYDRPATVDAKAKRLVDLLAANRQSVVPPSIHAQTDAPYRWVGEAIAADQLPIFTPDDLIVLEEILETLGWERGGRSATSALRTARPRGDYQDEWAETNGEALARAGEWLPALDLPKTRQSRSGVWSAVPVWRDSCTGRPTDMRKPNLSVSTGQGGIPAGIRDFGASGAEASLTAIDVVQRARDCSAAEAKDWLRERLGLDDSGVVIDIPGLWARAEERDLPAPLRGLQPPRGPVAADVSEMSPTPPVELPPDLLDCPGLVGEISAWMSRTAQKPLPLLNLAAALCIVATAAGRKFAGPTEAGVALYFLALAGTGQGKAHPIRAGVHLMTKAGLGRMVAPSSWMSGSALIQHLERQPACVSFSDEVAEFLAKLNGANPSYRGSQDKREFYDRAGAKTSELRRALNGMKEYEERGRPDAAQAIFADLDEPGKLFVTSQLGATPTRRLHPLERARVFAQEGSRIIGELNGAEPKDQGVPLPPMSRQTRRMVGDAIERVTVAELRNAMIATRQPGFENRKPMDRMGYWQDLRDLAPEVAAELERRLGVGQDRAYDYEAVMAIWPQVEQRLKAEGSTAYLDDLAADAQGRTQSWGERLEVEGPGAMEFRL